MKAIIGPLIMVILLAAVMVAWTCNLIKLTECDFDFATPSSDPSCELVHTAGLIPALSVVTVWFDSDKG